MVTPGTNPDPATAGTSGAAADGGDWSAWFRQAARGVVYPLTVLLVLLWVLLWKLHERVQDVSRYRLRNAKARRLARKHAQACTAAAHQLRKLVHRSDQVAAVGRQLLLTYEARFRKGVPPDIGEALCGMWCGPCARSRRCSRR